MATHLEMKLQTLLAVKGKLIEELQNTQTQINRVEDDILICRTVIYDLHDNEKEMYHKLKNGIIEKEYLANKYEIPEKLAESIAAYFRGMQNSVVNKGE